MQASTTYSTALRAYLASHVTNMFREVGDPFAYPFLVPGSVYANSLWDWDSWLSNVALHQVVQDQGNEATRIQLRRHGQGSVLNFLAWGEADGWLPIEVTRGMSIAALKPADIHAHNMHKPVLAQHAAFLTRQEGGDVAWLRESFPVLQAFLATYQQYHRHQPTGLYFWQTDERIGVDNDPGVFYRPPRSSGNIYLNTLMVQELAAMVYLCNCFHLPETAQQYQEEHDHLVQAIQAQCWDERDGFFYSVDLNLLPIDPAQQLHSGAPRHWASLLQRISIWTGFLPLWAGIATPAQAERMVAEHYRNPRTFLAPAGVRSLGRTEKMYSLAPTNNPSNWLGPIWGIVNYLVFRGLVRYRYTADARDLAEKTVALFGRDLAESGTLHEFYDPETGAPLLNPGFHNWNFLVANILAWLEQRPIVSEFAAEEAASTETLA